MNRGAITCAVKDGILEPCPALADAIEGNYDPDSQQKGVSLLEIGRFGNDGFRIVKTGVVLRSGKHKRRGVVMNYCPFCGENIGGHFHRDKERS